MTPSTFWLRHSWKSRGTCVFDTRCVACREAFVIAKGSLSVQLMRNTPGKRCQFMGYVCPTCASDNPGALRMWLLEQRRVLAFDRVCPPHGDDAEAHEILTDVLLDASVKRCERITGLRRGVVA